MDVQKLRTNKLIKELDYITSDYQYKYEIIKNADHDFIEEVNNFLLGYPDLLDIYNKKVDDNLNRIQESKISTDPICNSNVETEKDIEVEIIPKSDKISKIYRDIVKITHPDRTSNDRLISIYMDATSYYKNNDIISIYTICDKLGLEYDISISEEEIIQRKIQETKDKICFMETKLTWKWKSENNKDTKDLMVLSYIKSFILD